MVPLHMTTLTICLKAKWQKNLTPREELDVFQAKIDLIQVLENRVTIPELIKLKHRHAAETGLSMYRINI